VRINPWHLEHDLRVISGMGVKWLRTEFDWRKLEPVRGQMKFEWFDTLVKLCSSMSIRLVPVVTYTPKWLAPRFNVPPDPEAFADLMDALVRRYGHYVKHWEIWNEANSYFFWIGDAAQYAALVESASAAAKRADGESKILMCGLADPARPDTSFLFDVLDKTDGHSVDVLNLHAYPGTWNNRTMEDWPSLLLGLKGRLREIGVDKPLWVTETGLSSHEGGSLADSLQESYLVRAFASLLGSGTLERVFWYRLKDEASAEKNSEADRFGLLSQDTIFGSRKRVYRGYSKLSRTLPSGLGTLAGTVFRDRPKPAFKAYSALIRLLGQDFDSASSTFDGGAASVLLERPEGSIRIFWDGQSSELPQASLSGSAPFTLGAARRVSSVSRSRGLRSSSKTRTPEAK
jgi:glycosyl hydrolase family 42 (putative beta-galactosidase)